jgi:hypothetical protein
MRLVSCLRHRISVAKRCLGQPFAYICCKGKLHSFNENNSETGAGSHFRYHRFHAFFICLVHTFSRKHFLPGQKNYKLSYKQRNLSYNKTHRSITAMQIDSLKRRYFSFTETQEGWMSGLSRTPGKRVWVNSPPRVRIPPLPPHTVADAQNIQFCFAQQLQIKPRCSNVLRLFHVHRQYAHAFLSE